MILKNAFKGLCKGMLLIAFISVLFVGCGSEDSATDEIKKKVDSLDREIMEQLEKRKKQDSP